jgi:hypothetical protein
MRDLIGIDEHGYMLNSQNPSFGKVTKEKQCHARGKYKHDNGGVNLLMEISGVERVGHSFSFHRCYTKGGDGSIMLLEFRAHCPEHEPLQDRSYVAEWLDTALSSRCPGVRTLR